MIKTILANKSKSPPLVKVNDKKIKLAMLQGFLTTNPNINFEDEKKKNLSKLRKRPLQINLLIGNEKIGI